MRFLTLGLAGLTAASPLYPRDSPTISDVSGKIGSALTTLDNSVRGITKENAQAQSPALLEQSAAVAKSLNDGAAAVKASPPVSDSGTAISALLTAAPLALQGVTVVGDIVQKKEALKGAGLTQQVVDALNANTAATANFVNALLANMPSDITGLVSSIGLSDTTSLVQSIFGVGLQQFQSDAPPPDPSAGGGAGGAGGLGALLGGLGGGRGGGAGGAGGLGGLGALLGGLGGGRGGGAGGAGGAGGLGGLGALLGGLGGGRGGGAGGAGGAGGLGALLGGLGGGRGGGAGGAGGSGGLGALLGGLGGGGRGGGAGGANGLGALLGGLGGAGRSPPAPSPTASA